MEKEDNGQKMDTRKRSRAKWVGPTQPLYLAAWAQPKWASGAASPSVFDVPPHIYEKVLALEGEELSRNKTPPPSRSSFRGQIDPGFLLQWRDPETVFTAFISIDHELPLHHHV